MPGTTTDQGLQYPLLTDAPDGSDAILDLLSGVERRLVRIYASSADRASRVGTPLEGALCYLQDSNRLELYDGGAWWPVMESGGWTNVALPAGWATIAGNPTIAYRRAGQRVYFRGNVNMAASQGTGTLWNMPAGFRPTTGQCQLALPWSNGTAISGTMRVNVGTSGNVAFATTGPAVVQQAIFTGLSYELD